MVFDYKLKESLSEDKLRDYFIQYKAGDKAFRNTIIEHNIKLVIFEANKIKENTISYCLDELISIGFIGLIKAVDTFDVSKNYKFNTYAIICIRNEIIMFFRKNKKYNDNPSLDDTVTITDDGHTLKYEDILIDENCDLIAGYEEKELSITIRRLIQELPQLNQTILNLYFGFTGEDPLSQREIGKLTNLTQGSISRIIKRSLKIIKQNLYQEGFGENDISEIGKSKQYSAEH